MIENKASKTEIDSSQEVSNELQTLRKLKNPSPQDLMRLGELCARSGDSREGAVAYSKVIAANYQPLMVEASQKLVELCGNPNTDIGAFGGSEEEFFLAMEKACEYYPKDAKKEALAETYLRVAFAFEPPPNYWEKSEEQKYYKKAEGLYEKCIALDQPTSGRAYLNLLRIYERQRQWQTLADYGERLIKAGGETELLYGKIFKAHAWCESCRYSKEEKSSFKRRRALPLLIEAVEHIKSKNSEKHSQEVLFKIHCIMADLYKSEGEHVISYENESRRKALMYLALSTSSMHEYNQILLRQQYTSLKKNFPGVALYALAEEFFKDGDSDVLNSGLEQIYTEACEGEDQDLINDTYHTLCLIETYKKDDMVLVAEGMAEAYEEQKKRFQEIKMHLQEHVKYASPVLQAKSTTDSTKAETKRRGKREREEPTETSSQSQVVQPAFFGAVPTVSGPPVVAEEGHGAGKVAKTVSAMSMGRRSGGSD